MKNACPALCKVKPDHKITKIALKVKYYVKWVQIYTLDLLLFSAFALTVRWKDIKIMAQGKNIQTDVIIIGGGHAGLTLASLLGSVDVNVVCIDRVDPALQMDQKFDGRTTAISAGSRKVLEASGLWGKLASMACPIQDIRVIDGDAPTFLHFDADETNQGSFGWIFENRLLREVMFSHVENLKTVQHLAPASVKKMSIDEHQTSVTLEDGRRVTAPLLIGCDGRGSMVREWAGIQTRGWSYKQSAIICSVEHELDHENVALEHFLPAGPFAVLPMMDDEKGVHRSSVVWTEHGDVANSAINMDEKEFDETLQNLFGPYLGAVKHIGVRQSYPLGLIHAKSYTSNRLALVADAAHGIHPIAGQGLNLGMRDVACLAELIIDHMRLGLDIGGQSLLKKYEKLRRVDNTMMSITTDLLTRLFSNDILPVKWVRSRGLGIVHRVPPLKRFFARQAMGMSGQLGRIIRGEKL